MVQRLWKELSGVLQVHYSLFLVSKGTLLISLTDYLIFLCQFFQKGGVKEALNERELFNAVSGLNISADNEADFLAEVSLANFYLPGNGVWDTDN